MKAYREKSIVPLIFPRRKMEVNGQHDAPAASSRERTPVPIKYEAGCTPEMIWVFIRI
jgi:hypothetical protein